MASLERGSFTMVLSVPLMLEFESAAKRLIGEIPLSEMDIDDILDYVCAVAEHHKIHFLWRPFLNNTLPE